MLTYLLCLLLFKYDELRKQNPRYFYFHVHEDLHVGVVRIQYGGPEKFHHGHGNHGNRQRRGELMNLRISAVEAKFLCSLIEDWAKDNHDQTLHEMYPIIELFRKLDKRSKEKRNEADDRK